MGQQGKQSLFGRVAVVTGGCGGIGTAVGTLLKNIFLQGLIL